MTLVRDARTHDRAHAEVVAEACIRSLNEALGDETLAGTVLVAECGAAPLVLALAEAHPSIERVMACESDVGWLTEARAACSFSKPRVHFSAKAWRDGGFAESVFRASACVNGLGGARDARDAVFELARSTTADGVIIVAASHEQDAPLWTELLTEAAYALELSDVIDDARQAAWSAAHRQDTAGACGVQWLAGTDVTIDLTFASADEYLQSPWIQTLNRAVWHPLGGQELLDAAAHRLRTYFAGCRIADRRVTRCDVARVSDTTLEVADADVIVE